ncbi:MAG: flippase-like domain-containing protein [Bacteroidales bacterium]|nr:flippase-like domain-containing protein [Bacteroidales bacterium]
MNNHNETLGEDNQTLGEDSQTLGEDNQTSGEDNQTLGDTHPLKIFSFRRIAVPLLIGIVAAFYLIVRDFNQPVYQEVLMGQGQYYWVDTNEDGAITAEELFPATPQKEGNINITHQSSVMKNIIRNWTWYSTVCLVIAMCFGVLRDVMYMYRIRLLTDRKLSWKQSFQVIMLWEFGSAVTPSIVGGSALAFFIVAKEGIPVGRSTAIVMITALLDELFYIIIAPLAILFVGVAAAFITDFDFSFMGGEFGVKTVFAIGYGFMCLLTIFILVAIFIYPQGFRKFLYSMGGWTIFRRWKHKFQKTGDDIVISSKEFKGKGIIFWLKAYGCTVGSWTARFLVVNFLLLAFSPVSEQMLVFARQLVMWIILCISPTPGSSGIAEFAFPLFLKEFMQIGTASSLSLLWRIYTYYPYIALGLLVLPFWTKRVFSKKYKHSL